MASIFNRTEIMKWFTVNLFVQFINGNIAWKGLLIALHISISISVHAQNTNTFYTQFTTNHGLPDNSIDDIAQDKQGFIWLATKKGLVRFDGSNFIHFNTTTHKEFFEKQEVTKLYVDQHYLYLISRNDGVLQLNTKTTTFKRISRTGVESMFIAGNTTLFLYNNGKLELRVNNKSIATRKFQTGYKGSVVLTNSSIFLLLKGKRLQLLHRNLQTKKTLKLPLMGQSGRLLHSKKYGVIYSPGNSVYTINSSGTWKIHPELADKNELSFYSEDKDGKPLYVQRNKVPHHFYNRKLMVLSFDGNENWEVRSLFKINNNCVLMGTNQGLVLIGYRSKISSKLQDLKQKDTYFVRVRRKIVEDTNGGLYFLGYPGLVEHKNGKIRLVNEEPISTYDGIIVKHKLYYTSEGSGFYSYDLRTKKIKQYFTEDLTSKSYLFHVSKYQDSMLLIAGRNDLIVFNCKTEQTKSFKLQTNTEIYHLERQKGTSLFWASTSNGLIRFSFDYQNGIRLKPTRFKIKKPIKSTLIVPDLQQIWIATPDGLDIRNLKNLQPVKSFALKSEKSKITIATLVRDNQNTIWASTFSGIIAYNLDQKKISHIASFQGLENNEFNYKSFCLRKNGKIVFGGLNAFEEIETASFNTSNYQNDFFLSAIEKIAVFKKKTFEFPQKNLKKIHFQTGKEDVNIYVSTFDYSEIKGYKFTYSIGNQLPKILENNMIRISNLPNGKYQLKINMFDPLGKMVKEKIIDVNAEIPFYQTKQFFQILLTVVLILFIIAALLSMLSIHYYRRTISVANDTKNRIAMDLHDEAGTILTRLLMLTRKKNPVIDERQQINNGITDVLFSLRTFMDSLTREKTTVFMLIDDVRDLLKQTFETSGTTLHVEFDVQENVSISNDLFRDIKLCLFEVVSNCQKHAECSAFYIQFRCSNNTIHVELADDGRLTSIDELQTHRNGIKNIQKRVKRNKGKATFSIFSNNHGLAISLKFPIK
jgi:signal transduction histidine kinase